SDLANVGLVDRGPYLQALQVLGDQEQTWSVETGLHGLADVGAAVDDDAFDRGSDRGVAEVDLRCLQRDFPQRHVGLCYLDLRLGQIDLGLGTVQIISARLVRLLSLDALQLAPSLPESEFQHLERGMCPL